MRPPFPAPFRSDPSGPAVAQVRRPGRFRPRASGDWREVPIPRAEFVFRPIPPVSAYARRRPHRPQARPRPLGRLLLVGCECIPPFPRPLPGRPPPVFGGRAGPGTRRECPGPGPPPQTLTVANREGIRSDESPPRAAEIPTSPLMRLSGRLTSFLHFRHPYPSTRPPRAETRHCARLRAPRACLSCRRSRRSTAARFQPAARPPGPRRGPARCRPPPVSSRPGRSGRGRPAPTAAAPRFAGRPARIFPVRHRALTAPGPVGMIPVQTQRRDGPLGDLRCQHSYRAPEPLPRDRRAAHSRFQMCACSTSSSQSASASSCASSRAPHQHPRHSGNSRNRTR